MFSSLGHITRQRREFEQRFYAPPTRNLQAEDDFKEAIEAKDLPRLESLYEQYRASIFNVETLIRMVYEQKSIPFLVNFLEYISEKNGIQIDHFASQAFEYAERNMDLDVMKYLLAYYNIYGSTIAPVLFKLPFDNSLFDFLLDYTSYDPGVVSQLIIRADTENNPELIEKLLEMYPKLLDEYFVKFSSELLSNDKIDLLLWILINYEIPEDILDQFVVQVYDINRPLFNRLLEHGLKVSPRVIDLLAIRASEKGDIDTVLQLMRDHPGLPIATLGQILLGANEKVYNEKAKQLVIDLLTHYKFPKDVLSKALRYKLSSSFSYDRDVIHLLIRSGAEIEPSQGEPKFPETLLGDIISRDDFETIKYLVDNHYYTNWRRDPVHAFNTAMENSQHDTAKYLLEHALIPDNYDQSSLIQAINNAVEHGDLPMVEYLFSQRNKMRPSRLWTQKDILRWVGELKDLAIKHKDSMMVDYLESVKP